MLTRRSLLATTGTALGTGLCTGLGATMAAPSIARAASGTTMKFIPQSDLTVLDPIWTTAYVTRNHGLMVFDTLYGIDGAYAAQPQMVQGHVVENDGLQWRMTLRPGLRFHDGTPVLARDCVASIQRWGKRDAVGQTVAAYTDELSAPDDRTILFRLKRPFALLPDMLGKVGSSICAIMPERLARTDPFTQVTEMVGSGPFRFKADERMVGSLVVYEKFADYVPREGGVPAWTSGPKRVSLDRVEWHPIPDLATAAAAMQRKEMDWWETVSADVMPLLKGLKSQIADPTGYIGALRMNALQPPFDNPAIRRVLLQVVDQVDYMQAVTGEDPKLRHTPTGFFCPGLPMASETGLDVLTKKRDFAAAKKALAEAGYKNEKVVLMGASDLPNLKALGDVSADLLARAGFNVEYQVLDWGTVVQRRARKEPVSAGGWSIFGTFWAGLDQANPANNAFLRGTGEAGTFGWPRSDKLEAMRQQWLDAPDLPAQKALAAEIQQQALIDVPYVPLGQYFFSTVFQNNVSGVLEGPPLFWNVSKG